MPSPAQQLPTAHDEYARRISAWNTELARLDGVSGTLSNLRLITVGIAAIVIYLVTQGTTSWMLALPGLAFLTLVVIHSRVAAAIERGRVGRSWYEHGTARIDGTWPGRGADGERFLEGQPFAGDLDLFGKGSLFQLLSTARTEAGEDALAHWLLNGAAPAEVRARQDAVRELTPLVDFRESLAALTRAAKTSRTNSLRRWAAAPAAKYAPGMLPIFFVVGVISLALLLMAFAAQIDGRIFLAWAVLPIALVIRFWRRTAAAIARVDSAAEDLKLLGTVLERIEQQSFTSAKMLALRQALLSAGGEPSKRIAELLRLVTILDSTRNQMVSALAAVLMIPFQLAVAIDRWHERHAGAIPVWLDAVGEIEALSSLATYAFEHADDVFPAMAEDAATAGPVFDATALGHPLIAGRVAVRNDVALGRAHPHLLLVSGSNMSGKSTLLRAIGVNVVLALAGGPVRASSLKLSPLILGSSLRIEDSLQAGHSRFYAEILRIRSIVDLTRPDASGAAPPVLFLLDEVLAGTNSHDRRIGAEAIIRNLVARGAIGLVTTHDLALTEMAPSLGALAANVHFEDRIEDDEMIFDYCMRPGVVEHSNALALMRAVGLDV